MEAMSTNPDVKKTYEKKASYRTLKEVPAALKSIVGKLATRDLETESVGFSQEAVFALVWLWLDKQEPDWLACQLRAHVPDFDRLYAKYLAKKGAASAERNEPAVTPEVNTIDLTAKTAKKAKRS